DGDRHELAVAIDCKPVLEVYACPFSYSCLCLSLFLSPVPFSFLSFSFPSSARCLSLSFFAATRNEKALSAAMGEQVIGKDLGSPIHC
ncbi:MAG: hypothetical protein ACPGLY_15860, partial [Rubripirellula sp.]